VAVVADPLAAELSPFGGVKGSGLGVKEGVTEAMRWMTSVKTYSLPWSTSSRPLPSR